MLKPEPARSEASDLSEGIFGKLQIPIAEFMSTGDIRKLVTTSAVHLNYVPHLLRELNSFISKRHPGDSLVVIQGHTEQPDDSSEKALLAVIITANGGQIIHFTSHSGHSTITDTQSLRSVLKSTNCYYIMQHLSIPFTMGLMELLLWETRLHAGPNVKLCNIYLRRLSKQHGVLPPSFLLYGVERDGEDPMSSGGFADVYKGRLDQKIICLKVLRYFTSCTTAERQKLVRSFCHEALVWKQLDHPNILPFLGVAANLFRSRFCLISPWMCNGTINDFLQQNSSHDRRKAIREIAEAIQYLHGHDPPIVHADIRGANILITDDFRCCLADFGLASVAESQMFVSSTRSTRGTLRWMAPEYLRDDAPHTSLPSRDIYAFGCTVIEIYTGKVPFHYCQNVGAALNQILNGKHPRKHDFPPENDALWALLEDCWHQDPTCRPSAVSVLQRLKDLIAGVNKENKHDPMGMSAVGTWLQSKLEARRTSDSVGSIIPEKELRKRKPPVIKLLLLGQAEADKFSFLRNLQIYFAPKAFRAAAELWRPVIHLNLLRSVNFILDVLDHSEPMSESLKRLCIDLKHLRPVEEYLTKQISESGFVPESGETSLPTRYHPNKPSKIAEATDNKKLQDISNRRVISAYSEDIRALWDNIDVKTFLSERGVEMNTMPGFLLDDVKRITEERYIPTSEDILQVKVKIIGPEEHHIPIESDSNWRELIVYDVGWSRSQRAAWAQFFDDITAILFLVPASAFNEVLAEDESVNRLADTMNLWKTLCSNKFLQSVDIVLILNGMDILESLLRSGVRFGKYVSSYKDQPNELQPVSKYLLNAFHKLHSHHALWKGRQIYSHTICALDIKATSLVIQLIKDIHLRKILANTQILL